MDLIWRSVCVCGRVGEYEYQRLKLGITWVAIVSLLLLAGPQAMHSHAFQMSYEDGLMD